MKLKEFEIKNRDDLLMKSLDNKSAYKLGKYFEQKAIEYLKEQSFRDIRWVSVEKPTSHFDITAKKDDKLYHIEVRYTKSKKFQITEKKLNELEKLKNVLFLFISKEKKILIPLNDIKNEKYISINKGFINNLEIKKREVKGNKKSLLNQFINGPKIKIFDFLLDNKPLDFSKEEISRAIGISKTSIHKFWQYLEKHGIVKVTRSFGKTKLYTLNVKNPVTQKIIELEKTLISEAMDKASRKKEIILEH